MQAPRLLRKLCLVAAAGLSLAAPAGAHAGDVKISIRVPWLVPSIPAALSSEPGSPDEARARGDLQRLLDTGAMKVNLLEMQPGGFRIVRLERNG